MWTDSTTVLQRLNAIKNQPVLVTNRVADILDWTTVDKWHHVQTSDIPAEATIRGLSATALLENNCLGSPEVLESHIWLSSKEISEQNNLAEPSTLQAESRNHETESWNATVTRDICAW